ncbi:MAG: adenylyltransferase/cytidyltransferase family protein [Parcubacteria group bacterium]|nr:adenylyltransferase/cytidyltransferase family protein [Parcubacteria group bacterium]
MSLKNILTKDACLEDRYITDYGELAKVVADLKRMGFRIVLASGSWDLFHEGHAEYLALAKQRGDILVVGVDSDEKIRRRKGPRRPIVGEEERIRILSHVRHVDIIVLKNSDHPKHHLLKTVRPDVLIISESTGHEEGDIESAKAHCGEVFLVPPQSTTSTTAKVRLLHVMGQEDLVSRVEPALEALLRTKLVENAPALAQLLAPDVVGLLRQGVIGEREKK